MKNFLEQASASDMEDLRRSPDRDDRDTAHGCL